MATVTGMTAEAMLAIAGETVVNGEVDPDGNLILKTRSGETQNAGRVVGPPADDTPPASETIPGIVRLATQTETDAGLDDTKSITPKKLAKVIDNSGRNYKGVVSPDWYSGKPKVTLEGGAVVTAFLPSRGEDILPGDTVLLNRLPGDIWYIVAAVSEVIRFPHRKKLPLETGWAQYSPMPAGYNQGSYTVADGIVSLDGLIVRNVANNTPIIGRVPLELAPSQLIMFGVNNSDVWGAIEIYPNGEIHARTAGGSTYVSLAGVAWPLESAVTASGGWKRVGVEPGAIFQNSWVNYGGGTTAYGGARFWKDPITGLVWVQGLVASGGAGNNAAIFTMPTGYGAYRTNHLATGSNNTYGAVYANPTNVAVVAGTSNIYLTLCGMVYEPTTRSKIPYTRYAYLNGWADYSADTYTLGGYLRSPNGMVYHQGLLRAGTIGAAFTYVDENYRHGDKSFSSNSALFNRVANNARARVDIGLAKNIIATQGSNLWYSMDGLMYVSQL